MRHHKKKRPDVITNFEDVGNETAEAIYHALKPLDEMVHQMEVRWGVDRLVGLVSIDTAQRFGSAKAKLDAAVQRGDVGAVKKKAAVMIRAWKALNDEATKNGYVGLDPTVWTCRVVGGGTYAICQSNAEAHKVSKDLEGYRVFSLEEVARLIDTKFEMVGAVKDSFPDATIKKAGRVELNDDIPF